MCSLMAIKSCAIHRWCDGSKAVTAIKELPEVNSDTFNLLLRSDADSDSELDLKWTVVER